MSTTPADLYAYLRQKYPAHTIRREAIISFICSLDPRPLNCTFLCSVQLSNEEIVECIKDAMMDETAKMDLTGSPLKDDCKMDTLNVSTDLKVPVSVPWFKIEESYQGIDLQKCRELLSDVQMQLLITERNSLWVLCRAHKNEKVILQMLECCTNFNSRGIVLFRGMKSTRNIIGSDLVKGHLRKIRNCYKVDTSIDSFFSITPGMTIKLTYSSTSNNPSITDFRNSEAILTQTLRIGDPDSPAEDFWRQLCILSFIREDIVDYKWSHCEGQEPVYRCGRGIELETLRERVVATMTGLSTFDSAERAEDGTEIEAVLQRAKLRDNLDVTDKLWEILKCCSSYRDLKAGFNIVFQCAAKCNIVNPPTSNNRLAEIIREVSEHRLAIPCLTGSEPLELLLEIGLDKVSKDYEYIFTEGKICSVNDLEISRSPRTETGSVALVGGGDTPLSVRKSLHSAMQPTNLAVTNAQQRMTLLHTNNLTTDEENDLIGFQNSQFSKQEVEYMLSRLAQIHTVLEHLLQIQANLCLENVYNQICQHILDKPMRLFNATKNEPGNRLEIPILTESIIARIENKDPQVRRIIMMSRNNFKEVQTTYYYNMENIFPPKAFQGFESDEKEYLPENVYYCWEYSRFSIRRS